MGELVIENNNEISVNRKLSAGWLVPIVNGEFNIRNE